MSTTAVPNVTGPAGVTTRPSDVATAGAAVATTVTTEERLAAKVAEEGTKVALSP